MISRRTERTVDIDAGIDAWSSDSSNGKAKF